MMNQNAPRTLQKALSAAVAAGTIALAVGCAGAPVKSRVLGVDVPGAWIDAAEREGSDPGKAQACLALSRKLWERNAIEALRYLHRGALLGDAECCRQYLLRAEDRSLNQAQRAYARLTLERILRRGPLRTAGGEDVRGELYQQLCLAWRFAEPCSPAKAKQVWESLLDLGWTPERATSSALSPFVHDCGLHPRDRSAALPGSRDVQLYAGESAEPSRRWLRVPLGREVRLSGEWIVSEASPWAGGSERLFLGACVLAFLVDDRGEPSFRGTHLWALNLGDSPVYLTSECLGVANRELSPGREEILAVSPDGRSATRGVSEIPLRVRHPQMSR